MSTETVRQSHTHWGMPAAAKKFNRLEDEEKLVLIQGKVLPFYLPTTAYIFMSEMCIVAEYREHVGAEMKVTRISAMSVEQGLFRLKNIPGRRCLWHHLDPTPRSIKYLNKNQNEKAIAKKQAAY